MIKSFFIQILDQIKNNVPLSSCKVPDIDLIRRAYDKIESLPIKEQNKERRWLENYLNWLKKSYYNYYYSRDE